MSGSVSLKEHLACSEAARVEENSSKVAVTGNSFWLKGESCFSVLKSVFSKSGLPGSMVGESTMEDFKSLKSLRKFIESAVRVSLTNSKAIKGYGNRIGGSDE
jgi:hypothetical protein